MLEMGQESEITQISHIMEPVEQGHQPPVKGHVGSAALTLSV